MHAASTHHRRRRRWRAHACRRRSACRNRELYPLATSMPVPFLQHELSQELFDHACPVAPRPPGAHFLPAHRTGAGVWLEDLNQPLDALGMSCGECAGEGGAGARGREARSLQRSARSRPGRAECGGGRRGGASGAHAHECDRLAVDACGAVHAPMWRRRMMRLLSELSRGRARRTAAGIEARDRTPSRQESSEGTARACAPGAEAPAQAETPVLPLAAHSALDAQVSVASVDPTAPAPHALPPRPNLACMLHSRESALEGASTRLCARGTGARVLFDTARAPCFRAHA
jgi:hypothetical protein